MIQFTVTIHDPWSFFLSALIPVLIAVSVWLAGNGNIMSWPLGIAAHVISGVYAFVSGDWGWLLAPLVVSPVFVRNWVKWHRQQSRKLLGESTGDVRVGLNGTRELDKRVNI